MGDTERIKEKAFSNGDVYGGNFKGALPHGKGKYTWSDGTFYEGDWDEGKMTGQGWITWSSGAKYEGDFSGGYLHGSGTFIGCNGSEHRGAWRMNIQNGFGRKQYSNSDIYEGSWKEGLHEGCGRYIWNSGNTYIGNWKGGRMCGRGAMKWANGDIYDGYWLDGLRHGSGVYRFMDEGYYFGTWSRGLKDGKGTFYPAGTKHPSLKRWSSSIGFGDSGRSVLSQSFSLDMEECMTPRKSGQLSNRTKSLGDSCRLYDPAKDLTCHDFSGRLSHASDLGPSDAKDYSAVIYEREYMQGVLTKERIRNFAELSQKTKKNNKFRVEKVKGHSCVDIFNGRQSYYLMLNLQLGIRNLREMFKLDAAEYMMSICGDDGLREVSSPGKSGSLFYLSHDDRFVIKTLKKPEIKTLLKMLPHYYSHVKEHENTLITKFFGVHRITVRGGKKVRFVVMGNMFCTELRIHCRYDLKGSTQGRYTDKDKIEENTTLKDLDLSYEFLMDKLLRESLFKQLSLDCSFLESQDIIDYSLLLGLHFRAPEHHKAFLEPPATVPSQDNSPPANGVTSQGELLIPPKGLILVTHEPSSVNIAPGPHSRGGTLRAYSVGHQQVDLLLPGTGRLRVQLGVNMPAQASRKVVEADIDSADIELFEVYDVVLYMGIIDILQEYNMKKKVEHAYKSLQFDPLSISAVEPKTYAKRFIDFLEKVFPQEP
ncbi:phosphatidylinositol 4-phosphate 5-kinase 7-like isoform X2 [Tripterygium wilfordii]|uniref:phosphatidylinositol 4-phosphate 5-kinase 7-like isoform X2 n=1 Tax=Tripterygium wilfordii TaxID=458696 RepID=UPI0018F83725|nr:phosphatidylinositol 4-phosphate 5-kinase 7-like isoform X2 [Tripterygium wilfordii]